MTTAMTQKEAVTTNPETPVKQGEETRSWASPSVGVYEAPHEYLVVADIPGVTKNDISVTFSGGDLRVHASRPAFDGDGRPTDYRRSLTVGRDVDVEQISAEIQQGVLRIHLPKLESAKPRQIDVRASG